MRHQGDPQLDCIDSAPFYTGSPRPGDRWPFLTPHSATERTASPVPGSYLRQRILPKYVAWTPTAPSLTRSEGAIVFSYVSTLSCNASVCGWQATWDRSTLFSWREPQPL